MILSGADNFVGLNAGCADQGALDAAIDIDLDALQVRQELTEGLADDFGTGTAFFLFHTASFVFLTRGRMFAANDTGSHGNNLIS